MPDTITADYVYTLRLENMRCRALLMNSQIESTINDLKRTLPSSIIREHNKIVFRLSGLSDYDDISQNAVEENTQGLIRHLGRAQTKLQKFILATKPTPPRATMVSEKIRQITGLPQDDFLTHDLNRHTVRLLEEAVLVRFLPAKPKSTTKAQSTRTVALAFAKAIRELTAKGFRCVPFRTASGETPYAVLIVMPAPKISLGYLNEIESLVLSGIKEAVRKTSDPT